jgi:hypothetical protein
MEFAVDANDHHQHGSTFLNFGIPNRLRPPLRIWDSFGLNLLDYYRLQICVNPYFVQVLLQVRSPFIPSIISLRTGLL